MEEELSESDLQRVKDLEPYTLKEQDSTEIVKQPESTETNFIIDEELSESDLHRVKDLESQTFKEQGSTEIVERPESTEKNVSLREELSESEIQRVKDLEPQTFKEQGTTEIVRQPESTDKNDSLEQAAVKDEAPLSVLSNESLASEDLELTNSSSDEASDLKRTSPIVKWDSPASTTEPEIGSNSPFDSGQETSPDNQEIRPTTVSTRSLRMSRLRDIGKKFFEDAPNKIRDMFNSVMPRKEYSTDSSGATSSLYGEGSSGEAQTLQSPLQMGAPFHADVTSPAGISGSSAALGSSLNGPTTKENGSLYLLNKGGNLLSIQGSKVSNGKACTGEISNLKDDLSSPSKKAKLHNESEAIDESSNSDSSRDEVHISPEKENKITESDPDDVDMNEK